MTAIATINDLTKNADGSYSVDLIGSKYKGYVTAENVLADHWLCSYRFKISDVFWPTASGACMGNIKIFRLWSPTNTPVNFVVELNADRDGAKWVIEGISLSAGTNPFVEGSGLQVGYFLGGFKAKLTQDLWHEFVFDFQESTPGQANGWFQISLDGVVLTQTSGTGLKTTKASGLITQKTEGLKRPYIVGWANVPEGTNGHKNTFRMENISMNGAVLTPSTPPAPTPAPAPDPSPDYITRLEFNAYRTLVSDALMNLAQKIN